MTFRTLKCRNNNRKDVFPFLHMYSQDSQAYAELHSDRAHTGRIMLQQEQELVPEGQKLRVCDVGR